MEIQKKRNSNLELLRIVSMILIILHHYAVHGNFVWTADDGVNQIIVQIISLGGKIGVNCFLLITGYFLLESKMNGKKLLKLILETWFYSVSIFAIMLCVNPSMYTNKMLKSCLLPITSGIYWFATMYILLSILMPFIKILLIHLDKKKHFQLCLLTVLCFSILPTIRLPIPVSDLGWGIIICIIAAYLRKYPDFYTESLSYSCAFAIIFSLILIIAKILFPNSRMGEMNQFIVLLCSVFLFLTFKNRKTQPKRWINWIASSTFGVYLIHDNFLIRPILWNDILHNNAYAHTSYFVLHIISSTILVFAICIIIDKIRIYTIEKFIWKPFEKGIDFIAGKIQTSRWKEKLDFYWNERVQTNQISEKEEKSKMMLDE